MILRKTNCVNQNIETFWERNNFFMICLPTEFQSNNWAMGKTNNKWHWENKKLQTLIYNLTSIMGKALQCNQHFNFFSNLNQNENKGNKSIINNFLNRIMFFKLFYHICMFVASGGFWGKANRCNPVADGMEAYCKCSNRLRHQYGIFFTFKWSFIT